MAEQHSSTSEFEPYNWRDDQHWGAQQVVEREFDLIRRRCANRSESVSEFKGLALSGGGIRSATFALGVLQALSKHRVLGQFQYLSTVSGGGYLGACITWLLNHPENHRFAPDGADFPMADPIVGESVGEAPHIHRTLLGHLRQGVNYLTPGRGITMASLIAVVVRGMWINFFVYFPLLTLLMVALYGGVFGAGQRFEELWYLPLSLSGIGCLLMLIYAGTTRWARGGRRRWYRFRRGFDKFLGSWLMAILILSIIASLPFVHGFIHPRIHGALGGGIASLVGSFSAFGAFVASARRNFLWLPLGALVWIGAGFVLYGWLLIGYVIAIDVVITNGEPHDYGYLVWLLAALLLAWLVNVNFISIHRYYRDRLMETFMPDMDRIEAQSEDNLSPELYAADAANDALLAGFYPSDGTGPYHLVNTNVVIIDSPLDNYRGRSGDSFVLSPLYCGSNATGWQSTQAFMNGQLSLATAMAISGAAANPNTGVGGEGPTRNPLLSVLMSLVNIRLGYWVPNPDPQRGKSKSTPNLLSPGIAELLRWNLNEQAAFVQLSDGAHFENLGLYELLRRRLPLILCIDAGADPENQFADFGNLVEKVRVDFGIEIRIDLKPLMPDKVDPVTGFQVAAQGFQIGDIYYPNQSGLPGVLVYLRTTWLSDLEGDLVAYKNSHPEFPDQSTLNQFFDERQFEAYRDLGFHSAERALDQMERDPRIRGMMRFSN